MERPPELTRINVVKIDLTGAKTTAICAICGDTITIPQKDEMGAGIKVKRFNQENKLIELKFKTNKAFLKDFIEIHYGRHKSQEEKQRR